MINSFTFDCNHISESPHFPLEIMARMRGPDFNRSRPCLETKTINAQTTVFTPRFQRRRTPPSTPPPSLEPYPISRRRHQLCSPTSWLMDSLSQDRKRGNSEEKAPSPRQLDEKGDPRTSHVQDTVPTARDGRRLSPPMNAPRICMTLMPTRIPCEWFLLLSIVIVPQQTVRSNPEPRASTRRTRTICKAPMEVGTSW
jgi:hypothetical protein